jgi:DNA (cytosine-5)-methyltransferase 1
LEDIVALKRPPATVEAAIADLAGARPVGEDSGFDLWRRAVRAGRPFNYARSLHSPHGLFTGHRATAHTAEVVERFTRVPEGGEDGIGRHPRLAWLGQCPALRAGTGVEKGSYQAVRPIHPSEARVITVREAARLQGFPDSHRFHPTIWHSFRMIGNSVSPIIARAIFAALRSKFEEGQALATAAE